GWRGECNGPAPQPDATKCRFPTSNPCIDETAARPAAEPRRRHPRSAAGCASPVRGAVAAGPPRRHAARVRVVDARVAAHRPPRSNADLLPLARGAERRLLVHVGDVHPGHRLAVAALPLLADGAGARAGRSPAGGAALL